MRPLLHTIYPILFETIQDLHTTVPVLQGTGAMRPDAFEIKTAVTFFLCFNIMMDSGSISHVITIHMQLGNDDIIIRMRVPREKKEEYCPEAHLSLLFVTMAGGHASGHL